MKYMKWSHADLMMCPDEYLDVLYELVKKEAQEAKAASARRGR